MAGEVEVPSWLKALPLAPEFHPTEAEFSDPVTYILKIEAEARQYGVAKIVPPLAKAAKKSVVTNLNRSLALSHDSTPSSVQGSCSSMARSMSGSMSSTAQGGKPKGLFLDSSASDSGCRSKFTTRRQQLGWNPKRSRGMSQSQTHKLVWQSGESYTLDQFETKAKLFARSRLGRCKDVSPLCVESLFWKAAGEKPISVEYANDIPGSAFAETTESFSGTPVRGKKRKRVLDDSEQKSFDNFSIGSRGEEICQEESALGGEESENPDMGKGKMDGADGCGDGGGGMGRKLANSAWNMRNVARSPGSLLRFMPDEVPGVTSPMVYIGMLFSWFAWHVEDHELHSLNYLHMGASKTWYAVPGDAAAALEEAVRVHGYGGHLNARAAFSLLGEKTTVMSPEVLVAAGVPCCRLVQNAGEYVVTFPRAYHLGFSHGFNCGEAANFATPWWLSVAKEAAARRAAMQYLPMLSHQQLLYLLTMSLPSRAPSRSLSGCRSSRLKVKKKCLGDDMVKSLFVEDVAHNNHLLGVLLDKGVRCCLIVGEIVNSTSAAPSSEHLGQSKVAVAGNLINENTTELSLPPGSMQRLNSIEPVNGQELVNSSCLTTVSISLSVVTETVGKSEDVPLHPITIKEMVHSAAKFESSTGGNSVAKSWSMDWGTLPCAACGILCYASIAVVEPIVGSVAVSPETCGLQPAIKESACSVLNESEGALLNQMEIVGSLHEQGCTPTEANQADIEMNQGLSSLQLLAATYEDNSDMEDEDDVGSDPDNEPAVKPDSSVSGDVVGLSADASWLICTPCLEMRESFEEERGYPLFTFSNLVNGSHSLDRIFVASGFLGSYETTAANLKDLGMPGNSLDKESMSTQHCTYESGDARDAIACIGSNTCLDKNLSVMLTSLDTVPKSGLINSETLVQHGNEGKTMTGEESQQADIPQVLPIGCDPESCKPGSEDCFKSPMEANNKDIQGFVNSNSPRVLCLEHAVEAQDLLKSAGGARILLICHSDFADVEVRAREMAHELGIEHQWRHVPTGKPNADEISMISVAMEADEDDQRSNDWVTQLGLNVCHNLRQKYELPKGQNLGREFVSKSKADRSSGPRLMAGRLGLSQGCAEDAISQLQTVNVSSTLDSENEVEFSRKKKCTVAGRWCGRVWRVNQVHPFLGGCRKMDPSLSLGAPAASFIALSLLADTEINRVRISGPSGRLVENSYPPDGHPLAPKPLEPPPIMKKRGRKRKIPEQATALEVEDPNEGQGRMANLASVCQVKESSESVAVKDIVDLPSTSIPVRRTYKRHGANRTKLKEQGVSISLERANQEITVAPKGLDLCVKATARELIDLPPFTNDAGDLGVPSIVECRTHVESPAGVEHCVTNGDSCHVASLRAECSVSPTLLSSDQISPDADQGTSARLSKSHLSTLYLALARVRNEPSRVSLGVSCGLTGASHLKFSATNSCSNVSNIAVTKEDASGKTCSVAGVTPCIWRDVPIACSKSFHVGLGSDSVILPHESPTHMYRPLAESEVYTTVAPNMPSCRRTFGIGHGNDFEQHGVRFQEHSHKQMLESRSTSAPTVMYTRTSSSILSPREGMVFSKQVTKGDDDATNDPVVGLKRKWDQYLIHSADKRLQLSDIAEEHFNQEDGGEVSLNAANKIHHVDEAHEIIPRLQNPIEQSESDTEPWQNLQYSPEGGFQSPDDQLEVLKGVSQSWQSCTGKAQPHQVLTANTCSHTPDHGDVSFQPDCLVQGALEDPLEESLPMSSHVRAAAKLRGRRTKHGGTWKNNLQAQPETSVDKMPLLLSDLKAPSHLTMSHSDYFKSGQCVEARFEVEECDQELNKLNTNSVTCKLRGGPSTRLRARASTVKQQQAGDLEAENVSDVPVVQPKKKGRPRLKSNSDGTGKSAKLEEDGEFQCDLEGCRMSFGTEADLQIHKRNRCTFKGCGKRFFMHKYLLQHRRVHLDDRPLKCPWKGCKQAFKWAWARTEHIRVHTGERPYSCPVCKQTFRFVSDFSRHKRNTGHTKA